MTRYLLKRILLFVPTLFVVSLLAFYISIKAPGDPVEMLSQNANAQGTNAAYTPSQQYKDSVRARLGLNLPLFYFSLGTSNDCDTLYRVFNKQERYALHRLARKYGNWELVSKYYRQAKALPMKLQQLNADTIYRNYSPDSATVADIKSGKLKGIPVFEKETIALEIRLLQNTALALPILYHSEMIAARIDSAKRITRSKPYFFKEVFPAVYELEKTFWALGENSGAGGNLVPHFSWYGTQNQYHRWLVGFLRGDFGYSYTDQRPIAGKIWTKFMRSFTLVLLSVILAYVISIPLGVYSAKKHGSVFDRLSTVLVFLLYSIPLFFAGTMLLYFFANPGYFAWFPESGYCDPGHYNESWSWWQKLYYTLPYLVLPLITYTYASFAFISRIVRSATLNEMGQDYIRTARAKGLSENRILWRHAFRNALLPVITTFVNVFPAATAGSVVIETIYNYDGMGIGAYEAVLSRDYPMLVCIFTLAGLMSMIAYFIADILYAWVDPRIRYSKH